MRAGARRPVDPEPARLLNPASTSPLVFGYLSDFVVAPGHRIELFTSSESAKLSVRVIRLDGGAGSRPASEWPAGGSLGSIAGREQICGIGSCAVIPVSPLVADVEALTVQFHVWPTTPSSAREQGLFSASAFGLWIGLRRDGRFAASVSAGETGDAVVSEHRARAREWYRVTVGIGRSSGRLSLTVEPLSPWSGDRGSKATLEVADWPEPTSARLTLGATGCVAESSDPQRVITTQGFNGKLARPWVGALDPASMDEETQTRIDLRGPEAVGRPLLAWWDLARATDRVVRDLGPGGHEGFTVNTPTSAMTGPLWQGREMDFRRAPSDYDAIHFHADDLDDARWSPDLELSVPAECEGGIYGVELAGEGAVDVVPFVVNASEWRRARAALLLPTFTYLAYANQHWTAGERLALRTQTLRTEAAEQLGDRILAARPDVAGAIYDRHADGSARVYSSRRRPIVDMRADYRFRFTGAPRHFSADLEFARWLHRRGYRFDVITDEDLHREGSALLRRYEVVMTGSHPEYASERTCSAIESYCAGAGNLMYLGGNGFYYVTGVDPDRPHLIEVRRAADGLNTTGESPPGEWHLSVSGEPGGLWRHRGKPPQRTVGVGTNGIGWGRSAGYVRSDIEAAESSGWIFDGIPDTEPIGPGVGDFPGAASDEVDGAEARLGTPPPAQVIATSRNRHDPLYEAIPQGLGSDRGEGDGLGADMIYAESPNGGRLFSVGSMGWTNAVTSDTNAARVTENVLGRFLNDESRDPP